MSSSGEIFDYLLGEGDVHSRSELRRRVADAPEAALEMAELGLMLESLRHETKESGQVSPGLSLRVRYAIQRRARLRGPEPISMKRELGRILQVAAMMLLLLSLAQTLRYALSSEQLPQQSVAGQEVRGAFSLAVNGQVLADDSSARTDPELSELLDIESLPVADASFLRSLEHYSAHALPNDAGTWMHAENLLNSLREEQRMRSSMGERRQYLAIMGSPDLGDRIESLAETIAERARAGEGAGDAVATSLILRALLAADSAAREAPDGDLVRDLAQELIDALPGLSGGELARALAAVSELAVIDLAGSGGEPMDELVARHADRLARDVLRQVQVGSPGLERPALLSWRTPVAALADAGQVFKLAPAFGVHSGLAFRARLMVAAHLGERLEMSEREFPNIRAAQLYGFGDLVDRAEADRELLLWRARMLLPDYNALFQLAWSKYPARAGWAQFQRELRGLAAAPTPAEIDDAAALLLCLSSNFAAPGSLGVVQLAAASHWGQTGV